MKIASKIGKESTITFAGLIYGNINRYIYTAMLARWVGPEFLGIYSIANAIILILEVLSKMGIETGIMRFVSRLNPKRDHKKIQNLILSSFKMVFAFSIFVMALIIFLSDYIAFNLFKGDELLKKKLLLFFL